MLLETQLDRMGITFYNSAFIGSVRGKIFMISVGTQIGNRSFKPQNLVLKR
jgi:hypothetical protein